MTFMIKLRAIRVLIFCLITSYVSMLSADGIPQDQPSLENSNKKFMKQIEAINTKMEQITMRMENISAQIGLIKNNSIKKKELQKLEEKIIDNEIKPLRELISKNSNFGKLTDIAIALFSGLFIVSILADSGFRAFKQYEDEIDREKRIRKHSGVARVASYILVVFLGIISLVRIFWE